MIVPTSRTAKVASLLVGIQAATSVAFSGTYKVREGDSLWRVARRHDTHVTTLCELNGLKPSDTLQPGAILKTPDDSPASEPKTAVKPTTKQVKASKAEAPASSLRYIGVPVARLRAQGNTKSEVRAKLPSGKAVKVLLKHGDWARVKADDAIGWIRADLLSPTPTLITTHPLAKPLHGRRFVDGSVVNVRRGPGTNYGRVAAAYDGTPMRLVRRAGDWCMVRFSNGTTGWVATECIKRGGPDPAVSVGVQAVSGYAYVKNHHINLRQGPSLDYATAGQVVRGLPLRVTGRKGDWLRVRCSNGASGWVANWVVKVERLAAEVSRPRRVERSERSHRSSGRYSRHRHRESGGGWRWNWHWKPGGGSGDSDPVVDTARRFLGARYRMGGLYPSRGVDCSGLVVRTLNANGVKVPRTARDQYHVGRPVSGDDLKPGDLVFFKNTYRRGISHVGIYEGDGKFIHASRRGVRTSSLTDTYYRNRYAGAKRVNKK